MSSLNLQQSQICRSIGGRTVVPVNFQGERTYELLAYYHPLLSFLPVLTYDVTSTVRHFFSPPLPFVSRKSVTWRCIEIFVHRQLCHWYVTKHHRHVAGRWMRVYRQIWKHCAVENFSSELQIRILTMTWLTLVSPNGKTFDVSRDFLYVTLECEIALSIRILLLYLQTWNVFAAIGCERHTWIENNWKKTDLKWGWGDENGRKINGNKR